MPVKELQDKRIDHIYKLVETTYSNLEKIRDLLEKLDRESEKDKYRDIPGITGVFDGINLITPEGEKVDVPTNYSAKSRLVFGDTLKMIEEDGKQLFKQIEKVKRRKIEGILMKKEGKWYILADAGTYKVSDIAADFYGASLNDEAVAFIPEDNLNTPFATLDKVKTKESKEMGQSESDNGGAKVSTLHSDNHSAPVRESRPRPASQSSSPRSNNSGRNDRPRRSEPREDNRPDIRTEAQKAEAARPRPPRSNSAPRPRSTEDRRSAPREPREKEFVADIVRPAEQTPAATSTISDLDDNDLR